MENNRKAWRSHVGPVLRASRKERINNSESFFKFMLAWGVEDGFIAGSFIRKLGRLAAKQKCRQDRIWFPNIQVDYLKNNVS